MRKTILADRDLLAGPGQPGLRASDRQVQEFVRLYMKVDPEARRILERLVRHAGPRVERTHVLH
jgi:hypothetical protein